MAAATFNFNVAAGWVCLDLLLAATIAGAAGWQGFPTSSTKVSFLEGLIEGPLLGIPEDLAVVKGLPTVLPIEIAVTRVWISFWSFLKASLFPPLGSPYATGTVAFGLALYLLIVGTLLSATLTS
jgi:hypothetical protein